MRCRRFRLHQRDQSEGREDRGVELPVPESTDRRVRLRNRISERHGIGRDLEADRTVRFDRQGFAKSGGRFLLSYRGEERLVEVQQGSGFLNVIGLDETWHDNGL